MVEEVVARQQSTQRVLDEGWYPRTGVWELTLACNLSCAHCGSRAGQPRSDEMDLEKCLNVAAELADLGCEVMTLSGGEPTLREGWDELAYELHKRGIYVNMISNGVYATRAAAADVAERALGAGMGNVGLSIDGPQAIHDAIRGEGCFATTLHSLRAFTLAGLKTAVLTTVCQLNLPHLASLHSLLAEEGVSIWRLQLAVPMGVMSDHRDWVLRPAQLLELMPQLAALKQQGPMRTLVADSIGYYGPHDRVLRGRTWGFKRECWKGCQAGRRVVGIEANGNVKGCLSMQAPYPVIGPAGRTSFVEGNLQQESLASIWFKPGAFAYNRDVSSADLTGPCRRCTYAELCRGGARCISAATQQVLSEDEYCYFRLAQKLKPRQALGEVAAAVAAAALLGLSACGESEDPAYGVPADLDTTHELGELQPAYGVPLDLEDGPSPDLEQPAYGVPVDVEDAPRPDQDQPAYGVPMDVEADGPAEIEQPAYGVPIDF